MPFCRKSFVRLASFADLGVLLLPIVYASQKNAPARPAAFPSLTAYSLNKAKLNLPQDFSGQVDLLLISFRPEQQKQIDGWMPVAQALQHTNFNFRWYQMPVSSSENFVFRWWDSSSMRSDDTDPETWPWIVPLYVDKLHFRRSLRIPTEKQIAVLLVNKKGNVLWHAEGAISPEKRQSLIEAVNQF